MSAGLFYIFCDETYLDLNNGKRIVTGYIAVPQDSWNRMAPDRRSLRVPHNISRMARIERILDATSGVAAVTYADLKFDLLATGERNGTNDIPDMSRYDHCWSVVLACGLPVTLIYLGGHNREVRTVDIYYDTRCLKEEHQSALNRLVTQTLPEIVREARRANEIPRWFRVRVRRLQSVSKAVQGGVPDKFQAGVLVAHNLLIRARDLIRSGGYPRIYVSNNTQVVTDYIQTFNYHGNTQRHIFHGPKCRYYNCKNGMDVFYSRDKAIKAGYRPCKICNP